VAELETLLSIERELAAAADGGPYRRHLRDDAVLVVPGQALDKQSTVVAFDNPESPPWDDFSLAEPKLLMLGRDAAVLTYLFAARRGENSYDAILSSTYVREGEDWLLVFHQQTPL
jgi:Domain of unknown function (DUF4440)